MIAREFTSALIGGRAPASWRYRLYVEVINAPGLWGVRGTNPVPAFVMSSRRFSRTLPPDVEVIATYLSLKWLNTLLLIPANGLYDYFDTRVGRVIEVFKVNGYTWLPFDSAQSEPPGQLSVTSPSTYQALQKRLELMYAGASRPPLKTGVSERRDRSR